MGFFRSCFRVLALWFPLLIVMVAIAITIAGRVLSDRIHATEMHSANLTTAALRLERSLGFGGFIHHFKNYVLRPTEEQYRIEARLALAETLDQIDAIEALAALTDAQLDLFPARQTLMNYASQIDVVTKMATEGASAREIDRVVRVDDGRALDALVSIIHRIERRYEDRRIELQMELDRLGALIVVLALLVYAAMGCQLFRALYHRPFGGNRPDGPDQPA